MAGVEGVDYAWGRPHPAALAEAGKKFAVRYLSYNATGKNLTTTERDALLAAGVLPVLVWETTANAALGGQAAGRKHATDAAEQARRLGAPPDCVIYFAVDFNPTTAQLSTVNAYFDGVCSVLPFDRVGVYGGLRTMMAAKTQAWARFLWQTYAWSGGLWAPGVHAQQYRNGVTFDGQNVDFDRAMVDYIGQWDARGAVHNWEGDDMTPAEWIAQPMGSASLGIASKPLGDWLKAGEFAARGVLDLKARLDTLTLSIAALKPGVAVLSATDRAAIASDVHAALKADLAAMLGALAPGKSLPASGGAPVGT